MRQRLQTKAERQAWRQQTIDHHIKEHGAQVRSVYDLIILTYDEDDKYYLKIWKANGAHPFDNYYFRSIERRQTFIDDRIDSAESRTARKAERNRIKSAFKADLKPGDIYYTSWGYDQTNVDFYRVDSVKGSFAILQEIAAKHIPDSDGSMSCRVIADPTRTVGDPIRKKICVGITTSPLSKCAPGAATPGSGTAPRNTAHGTLNHLTT